MTACSSCVLRAQDPAHAAEIREEESTREYISSPLLQPGLTHVKLHGWGLQLCCFGTKQQMKVVVMMENSGRVR